MSKKTKRNNQSIQKTEEKALIEKKKREAHITTFKEISIANYQLTVDPELVAEKGGAMLQKYLSMKNGKERDEFQDEVNEKVVEYSKAMSLDTKIHVLNGIDFKFGGMALEMMRRLEKEYKISSPQDKGHMQIAVSAFCRYHSIMNEFQSWKSPRYLSHEVANLLGTLSKEADRAFRQYHSIIQYFEAKKNPPLIVNVKTKTAFIAQNQQNVATNPKQDENNAPE